MGCRSEEAPLAPIMTPFATVRALLLVGRRHLLDRPVRTLMTLCGIALGVAVSVAIRSANVDVLRSFEQSVISVAGRATLEVSSGALGLDEALIATVRRHPAVVSAEPILEISTRVIGGPHGGRTLRILAVDLLSVTETKAVRVRRDGGVLADTDALLEPDTIFLGSRLAERWGLRPGDSIQVVSGTSRRTLVVRGVIDAAAGLRATWEELAVMDIASGQTVFDAVGRLDRIDVETAADQPVSAVRQDLAARLPPSVTVRRPIQRTEQVERMVRAFQLNLMTLSGVGLLIGLLLVYNTVSFTVVQRRRELGILRALGMTRARVSALFLCEAAMLGLVGGLAGALGGRVLANSLLALMSRTVSELYVSLPSELGDAGFTGLPPLALAGQGAALGMVVSMLGALAPSVDAGRTAPARALAPGEYEAAQEVRASALAWGGLVAFGLSALLAVPGPVDGLPVFGYLSALCLLVGLSCVTPLTVRTLPWLGGRRLRSQANGLSSLAADQVARTPGRNAVTVSALMIGVTIMVGVGIMIQSFRSTVEFWIDQTVLADLIIAPASWPHGEEPGLVGGRLPVAWRAQAAAVPGVAAVDAYRDLPIQLDGHPVSLVSRDLRLHAEHSRYLFMEGPSADILRRAVAQDGVVISEVLANTLSLARGGALRLNTPAGNRDFPILGVFYDYATDGGKIVMDRRLYDRHWGDDTTTVLAVYLIPGTDLETVRQRLRMAFESREITIISNVELKQEILAIFDRTFLVTYALELIAVVIALLGIVNTLLTSVLERQRELATLRAVGAGSGQIRALVLWEAGYLGLLGGGLGLAGGTVLSWLLIGVINKQSFGWTIQFFLPLTLLGKALVSSLIAALVAGYIPARWASAQPIADGLRYE